MDSSEEHPVDIKGLEAAWRQACIRSGYENFILASTTAHGVPYHHGNTGGITP